MSNTTTPTRPGRGIPVPGIDTRGPAHKEQAASMTFSGRPLTPPQSATESRRPSLAYSSLSDVSTSGPPSIADYSQPSTPVQNMAHDDFNQHWTDGVEVQANQSNSFNDGCLMGQVQPMFQTSFHHQSMCSAPAVEAPMYGQNVHQAPNAFTPQQSPLRQEAWSGSQLPSMGINMHAPGLETTLFQNATGIKQEHAATASMFLQPSGSIPCLAQSAFPNYDNTAPVASSSMFQAPHTVVPSQLSPQEDYPMDHYPCKDEEMSQDFTSSFDSAMPDYSPWEIVGPQSPQEAYFTKSEDDDYVMIKEELSGTPSRALYRTNHRYLPTTSPGGTKPRSSKRSRRSHATGKIWHEYEGPHCRVRYEGKPFWYDEENNKIIPHSDKERKPFKCHFVKNGETCGDRFERGEHLKRHMTSHSKERPYPCPLDKCDRAISRPDNAGDHFKTHLRAPAKGKRNKFCPWDVLQAALLREYPEKKSAKILTNLRKWMANLSEEEKGLIAAEEERLRKAEEEKVRLENPQHYHHHQTEQQRGLMRCKL